MMKVVLFAVLACVVAVNAAGHNEFVEWMNMYGKSYEANELDVRRANFDENVRIINEVNSQNLSWTAGLNEYSDLSWAEFSSRFLMAPQHCSATQGNHVSSGEAPGDDTLDWRTKNVVTPVKNQGGCGSCWAFSTTGCLESIWAINQGALLQLSEQQLVDCARAFGNAGCNGGLPSQAFEYIKAAGGINLGKDYTYTGRDGSCRAKPAQFAAKVTGEVNITQGAENDLFDAVTKAGPIAVAFQVVSDFQSYRSGVYDSTRCRSGPMDVNHAVLAVGYGTLSGKPYWIVKNSWGTSFGIQGYFYMVRNKNMCGVATCASYPTVK